MSLLPFVPVGDSIKRRHRQIDRIEFGRRMIIDELLIALAQLLEFHRDNLPSGEAEGGLRALEIQEFRLQFAALGVRKLTEFCRRHRNSQGRDQPEG